MIQDSIIEDSQKYLMHTYARFPIVMHKGRGARVWTADGKRYLDFLAGIAVNCLGHCHPRVVVAIQKQAQRLLHVSNLYHIEPQARLAKLLVENSFANKAFFCNSGAEANEAAIKLARKYSKENFGQERFEIVAAHGSFHGRTMAALSATGQEQYRKGFGPMLQGFRFVPFNDVDALKDAVGQHTCAVILEPVQAEGGVKVPGGDYFRHVRDLCNKKNVLLILDEVQTGIGRSGKLFAHEHYGIAPDIMTLAKGLGGGVAIGAMLATDTVAAAFTPGTHASTFGGNPLACAAAIATLETVLEDGLILSNAERMSAYLMDKLKGFADKFPRIVKDVRGLGLLAGIEIEGIDPPRIVRAAMDAGLLIGRAGENVIRFTPPLIVSEEEIDEMAEIMGGVLSALDTAP